MAVPPGSGNAPSRASFQRLLSRAEAVTLVGMVLSMFSLFLVWQKVSVGPLMPLPGALFVNAKSEILNTGAAMPAIRWPITVGALLSGLTLAFVVPPSRRMLLVVIQALGGLTCFLIAVTHFSLQPGVLVDLAGGALLTFGAVDRMSQPEATIGIPPAGDRGI